MTWQDQANRALTMFEGSSDDNEDRSWQIFNHVLDETNRDDYISHDFFNVQQTAGGLPDGVTFDDFVNLVAGHVRAEADTFDEDLGDDDFRTAALSFDAVIRRHIDFLNGVVHQAGAGVVHVALWNLILSERADDTSIYACYRDYLVDASLITA
jgi:hypothetical protein